MGFLDELAKKRGLYPTRDEEIEDEDDGDYEEEEDGSGDALDGARRLFERGRELMSTSAGAEEGLELVMEAVSAGLPEAALYVADVYLNAFAEQYPRNFHPRWCHSIENAKAFCSFCIMAEHFGADEAELSKRMSSFLSHFGGKEDIEIFISEFYVPLRQQILARLIEGGM